MDHYYCHQIQGQLYMTGCDVGYLAVWAPQQPVVYFVEKDSSWEKTCKYCSHFSFINSCHGCTNIRSNNVNRLTLIPLTEKNVVNKFSSHCSFPNKDLWKKNQIRKEATRFISLETTHPGVDKYLASGCHGTKKFLYGAWIFFYRVLTFQDFSFF